MNYSKVKDVVTGLLIDNVILRDDGIFIPFDINNSDYQKYLIWLSEGNNPIEPN